MVWWRYVEVWAVAEAPNSRARKLACPPRGHRVAVVLPCVLGGLGMSSLRALELEPSATVQTSTYRHQTMYL